MACYHPIGRLEYVKGTRPGNPVQFISSEEYENFYENKTNTELLVKFGLKKANLIGCGQCIGCRLDRSRQWADRIVLEAKEYKNNFFVTLTYDDAHLKFKQTVNEETGEIITGATLVKKDMSDFMKKLRRNFEYHNLSSADNPIRFFGCGEYGEQTERPHYHLNIFNLNIPPEEIKFYKNTFDGNALFTCERLEKIWGKGYVVLAELNWDTAAYTARYIMKKQLGPNSEQYYLSKAKNPEFTLMSRKPGIGKKYYDANKDDIYVNDEIIISHRGAPKQIKPPHYYDKLYDITNHDELEQIKRRREKSAKEIKNKIRQSTDKTLDEYRELQERTKTDKTRKLIRNKI